MTSLCIRTIAGALRWIAAGLVAAACAPASALVVDPFFAGSTAIPAADWAVHNPSGPQRISTGISFPLFFQSGVYVSPDGYVAENFPGTGVTPGNWSFNDSSVFAPLWMPMNPAAGGKVTYGNPAPGVLAVSWVNVPTLADPSLTNTFQVVFIGTGGFSTNTGVAIQPGSIIFGYGNGGANGSVNLPAGSGATIGYDVASGASILSVNTLNPLGIGDGNGGISAADLPALLAAGDPFLFNGGGSQPLAFTSVIGLSPVPEPLSAELFGTGLVAVCLARRRRLG